MTSLSPEETMQAGETRFPERSGAAPAEPF
jgi:hypothetical protein